MVGGNELKIFLTDLPPQMQILLIGASPIGELRIAIPFGYFALHLPIKQVCLWAILGNILPIAPILLFFKPVAHVLRHIKIFRGFFLRIFKRARKNRKLIEHYGALGLAIFVSIPLPMTGAWTGAAIASIFRVRFRYAFLSVVLGVIGAGIIVSTLVVTGKIIYRAII